MFIYMAQLSALWPHTHTTVLRPSWILSGTTQVSRHHKGKTRKVKPIWIYWARDSEWQQHQLGHMPICTLTQTHNHASVSPLSFFTGWMPYLPPIQQHQSTENHGKPGNVRELTAPVCYSVFHAAYASVGMRFSTLAIKTEFTLL